VQDGRVVYLFMVEALHEIVGEMKLQIRWLAGMVLESWFTAGIILDAYESGFVSSFWDLAT